MAITSETSAVEYEGNDSTSTAYVVPFLFFSNAHLKVTVTDADDVATVLALTTDYAVTGANNPSGGTVTTVEAYDDTHTVRIERVVPVTQPFVYEEGGRLPMKTLEKNFDTLAMQVQQLHRAVDEIELMPGPTGATGPAGADGESPTTANVLAVLNTSSSIIVNANGTDTERGTALAAAYEAAKLLTPNGAARSATNRACVVIPPGKYKISNFQLDAEFIDIFPSVWEKPSRIQPDDVLGVPDGVTVDLTYYRPGATVIYSDVDYVSTVVQLADDVRMGGFTISHLGIGVGFLSENKYFDALDWGALLIGEDCDNAPSQYVDLYCFCSMGAFPSCGGVRAYTSFSGTWTNCVANGPSFRSGYGDKVSASAVFSATMKDCEAMPFSFVGDYLSDSSTYTVGVATFTRCEGIGNTWEGNNGEACFAGCNITGVEVPSTMTCIDCTAGQHSFGIGNVVAGKFIRCRGGNGSFGSSNSGVGYEGTFAGIAEDCVGGAGSFGGNEAGTGSLGKCTGTLTRCTVTGNSMTTRLEGATIRDSRITATTTGVDLLALLDSNSSITNSELIVFQGGTGRPINAASALNVVVAGCRMNNASNDADGLGSNVTNLVSSAGNVVSNSIR